MSEPTDWLDIEADLIEAEALCTLLISNLREIEMGEGDRRIAEAVADVRNAKTCLHRALTQLKPYVTEAREQEGEE